MKGNKRAVGNRWEDVACQYLEQEKIRILCRNFKSYRGGEIDIIAKDESGTVIFAEVKYRRSMKFGLPQEAVGFSKQKSICHAADYYRARYALADNINIRFDVIAIYGVEEKYTVTWIKNAFEYMR